MELLQDHGLIMAPPRWTLKHGEEVCSVLFVSRGEAPEVIDAVEEALDAVACPIEPLALDGIMSRSPTRSRT